MRERALQPDQIKRVVVRGTNWVGDAVMTVPALRELRRVLPDAHITLASRPGTADIFVEADFVDDVLIYDRAGLGSFSNQVSEWKKRRFDLAILFQNAFEAALLAFLARVPMRVGYDVEHRGRLLTHPLPSPDWKDQRHEIFYYANVIAELERTIQRVSAETEPRFELNVSSLRQQKARGMLSEHGARPETPVVLLCPGSVNSRAKRWPAERYASLGDRLVEAGATVVLIGSPAEMDVSDQVRRQMQRQPAILTGETSVEEATAIISVADLLITNDTGPAHIAAAVGTPALVIFGPTNPLTTYPFGPKAQIIRHPPECAPCMLRDCPIDHRCMTAITPDEVFEKAVALIGRRVEVSV